MVATFLGLCVLIVAVSVPTAGAINRWLRLWWQDFQDANRWRPADHQLDTDLDATTFIEQLHQTVAAEVAPRDVPTEVVERVLDALQRWPSVPVPQLTSAPSPVPLPRRLAVAAEPLPAHVESFPVGGRVQIEMTRTEGLPTTPIEPTPIFDEWREEYRLGKTLEKRRLQRALRQPTQEMRAVFDEIVEDWLCSHCDGGDHGSCPGCSCPAESCRLAVSRVG
jgi:hypothetical protein